MATWSNFNLQNSASPLMEQLIFFHDHSLLILSVITMIVSYMMLMMFFNKINNRFLLEGQTIEVIWTILPAITLIFIALPSLRLLYLLDDSYNPLISIKSIGNQWYWSYEYMDFKNKLEFESYMIPSNESMSDSFRLLDVDNRTILPMNIQIRNLVTSNDVIHSWTIPALGVKSDATPGRLNQISFLINRPGVFFGQCSEICGANHSFMPIVIESIPLKFFLTWVSNH
uniref:Cytochrome c oxidase subunit 2 n=1 Tax=Dianemobius fascipes TaxID=1581339 RepID=A0A6B9VWM1_9ORTH|nr:cytochrome c oxidase subunit II [Dianemobius fascipes]QHQ73084.1 cytochrome c oxidase subunit 2 [Dianemobius fascipes]WBK17679.1 cytochrome c oxidase subunit 2 [Dianemobius fascipes nigrofasciatus]